MFMPAVGTFHYFKNRTYKQYVQKIIANLRHRSVVLKTESSIIIHGEYMLTIHSYFEYKNVNKTTYVK